MTEKDRVATRPGTNSKVNRVGVHDDSPYQSHSGDICGNRDPQRHIAVSRVEGHYQTCTCNAGPAVPPIVLEPFCGSGTTIQVARHIGFRAIGFEVNPAYIELAKKRIEKAPRCFMPKKAAKKPPEPNANQSLLF